MVKLINDIREQIIKLRADKTDAEKEIHFKKTLLQTIEDELYDLELKFLHICRIYRLAQIHFPRLRGENSEDLTSEDIQELEKWINRAKSPDSLKDIVDALAELSKYFPKDIKSNLYGLIQKIIIEGAYRTRKENENGKSKSQKK